MASPTVRNVVTSKLLSTSISNAPARRLDASSSTYPSVRRNMNQRASANAAMPRPITAGIAVSTDTAIAKMAMRVRLAVPSPN